MASPNGTPLIGRLCDAGRHTMDPTWETCPYCDAEKRSKENTQVPQQVANDRSTRKSHAPQRVADDRTATVTRVGFIPSASNAAQRVADDRATSVPADRRIASILADNSTAKIGAIIKNLKIISKLGEGGMAVVYLAEHITLKKRFAVKSLSIALSGEPQFRERFFREAQNQALISHPNIVQAVDFFEEGGQYFLVMEYVEGRELGELIKSKGKLSEQEAISIFEDILAGLNFAHKKGVIHRDMKPSNILIDETGRARITDFGIAILARGKRLTSIGVPVGTAEYMSPEQIKHPQAIDKQSDIYSAGLVLYEMLTGELPFQGETDFSIIEQQVNSPLPDPRLKNPAISSALVQCIQKATQKDPAKRFQDCAAFLDCLRETSSAPPASFKPWSISHIFKSASNILAVFKGVFPRHKKQYSPEQQTSAGKESRSTRGMLTRAETVLEAVPSGTRLLSVNSKARHRPLGPQDVTLFFQGQAPSEQLRLPAPVLTVTQCTNPSFLGKRISLSHFPFRIGRASDMDYVISDDPGVSREHLILDYKLGKFTVYDAGSRNRTYINGRLLQLGQPEQLFFGDQIRLSSATTLTLVPDELQELPDLTGKVIDNRFRLIKLLHSSAKAVVYAAQDQHLPQSLAVKVFSPQLSAISAYMEQFRREAEAAVCLRHDHICRVNDFGLASIQLDSTEGTEVMQVHYLSMELMDGGNLEDWIEEEKPIPLNQITDWISKLSGALDYAHEQGVIHSGIKPSSIVFNQNNSPCITDFAIASQPRDKTGCVLMGAPAFLAPEQWVRKVPTPATDQYSLAVLTYILVTGARPYEGQEYPSVRERNFARGPIPAHDQAARNGRTDVSPAVSRVLERALAIRPEDRYPSLQEFAHEFEIAVSMQPVSQAGEPRIFISYHRIASSGWASFIAQGLKLNHGISPFIDTQHLDSAVSIPVWLKREIEQCDVFVCLLADSTLESSWVKEEIRLAHETKKPMVPVFQQSFSKNKVGEQLEPHIKALLNYRGVHLFDHLNIHTDHTIADLAQIVKQTILSSKL